MTQAEWYAQKALEEKERVEAAHALKMSQRRMDMGASPNSYSPGEKQAVDSYFREKEASRQFDEGQQTARGQWGFTDADGTHHAGGAEKVAEYDYMGRSDQGMGAAKINAEASKYNSDNTLKGIQAQAKSAQEIEREKQKYLDIINGRDNATKIRQSEIEWGIHKPDGTFTPGGRVKQAEEQGKAAAKIAEQNNQARIETVQQACELDDKLLASWTGHPHLRVIDNATDFEVKMRRLIGEISACLGQPGLMDTRRRYLIEYPDIACLEGLPSCRKVEIIQTYLHSGENSERRVGQRGVDGHYIYYETILMGGGPKAIEVERRLTQNQYLTLLMEADTSLRQIRKTRYCMTWKNQVFEIDVYPFWQDRAIAEIETSDNETQVVFPDAIHVIRDVTDEKEYKNAALAGKKL